MFFLMCFRAGHRVCPEFSFMFGEAPTHPFQRYGSRAKHRPGIAPLLPVKNQRNAGCLHAAAVSFISFVPYFDKIIPLPNASHSPCCHVIITPFSSGIIANLFVSSRPKRSKTQPSTFQPLPKEQIHPVHLRPSTFHPLPLNYAVASNKAKLRGGSGAPTSSSGAPPSSPALPQSYLLCADLDSSSGASAPACGRPHRPVPAFSESLVCWPCLGALPSLFPQPPFSPCLPLLSSPPLSCSSASRPSPPLALAAPVAAARWPFRSCPRWLPSFPPSIARRPCWCPAAPVSPHWPVRSFPPLPSSLLLPLLRLVAVPLLPARRPCCGLWLRRLPRSGFAGPRQLVRRGCCPPAPRRAAGLAAVPARGRSAPSLPVSVSRCSCSCPPVFSRPLAGVPGCPASVAGFSCPPLRCLRQCRGRSFRAAFF